MNKDARSSAAISSASGSGRSAVSGKAKSAGRSPKSPAIGSRRTWIVLGGLLGGLAFTGALLKALAPPPLTPDATASLYAVGQEQPIDPIFDTLAPVKAGRWHSIYVHQSLTESGSAATLSRDAEGLPDHFIIGNGDPMIDGSLEHGPRWNQQLAAGAMGGVEISEGCISICLVGDFRDARPSAAQQAKLVELITGLQRQLSIPSDRVYFGMDFSEKSAAGLGAQFPISSVRSQLVQ